MPGNTRARFVYGANPEKLRNIKQKTCAINPIVNKKSKAQMQVNKNRNAPFLLFSE